MFVSRLNLLSPCLLLWWGGWILFSSSLSSGAPPSSLLEDNVTMKKATTDNTAVTGRIIKDEGERLQDFSLRSSLEHKVYDIVAVTDWYGLDDPTGLANEEDEIFIQAVEQQTGRKVTRVSIQDESFDWRSAKSIVIRSAWAKYRYLDYYKFFLDTVSTHSFLFNPRELMRWQSNKVHYMSQLANYVKVPHTLIIHEYDPMPDYEEAASLLGCENIIIKPAQGNAGIGVFWVNQTTTDLYYEKMSMFLQERREDMLIQCFQWSIPNGIGEINIYVIDGQVTHAGWAKPAPGGYLIHEEKGGYGDDHSITDKEVEYAMTVYQAVSNIVGVRPLYMRVDVMYDNDGELTLMELACGSTDLNFRDEPEAADVMAKALDRFLSEKEDQYETSFGKRPDLISLETYKEMFPDFKSMVQKKDEYAAFGTPLKDYFIHKEHLHEVDEDDLKKAIRQLARKHALKDIQLKEFIAMISDKIDHSLDELYQKTPLIRAQKQRHERKQAKASSQSDEEKKEGAGDDSSATAEKSTARTHCESSSQPLYSTMSLVKLPSINSIRTRLESAATSVTMMVSTGKERNATTFAVLFAISTVLLSANCCLLYREVRVHRTNAYLLRSQGRAMA